MKLAILSILVLFISNGFAQNDPVWDNTQIENWPEECTKTTITSSMDGKKQPAIFYAAKEPNRPLIVSLHTWSGNYEQEDLLIKEIIKRDYNYIHPDFRGPNKTYEACGSEFVIQDIEDAIAFAIEKGNASMNDIHVIGTSGGGHATLLTYMNTDFPVKTFSAWVPISDIEKWYYESEGRGNKYSRDIALSTVKDAAFDKDNYHLDEDEAIKRSPIHMPTPIEKRKNSKLYIYAGIHDGYTGSVPISQSLDFYNKVVADYDTLEKDALVPQADIKELLASRNFVVTNKDSIADRLIHYRKTYKDLLKITIFEGSHECLTSVALDHIETGKILAIGDSNGAKENGWVDQLRKAQFEDFIFNASISGNTIGFDNNGQEKLNTLTNLDRYMEGAEKALRGLDKVVILLGTNDCKAVFGPRKHEIPENMDRLLKAIKSHTVYHQYKPQIYVVSPPPCGEDDIMKEKYHGSSERVKWLIPQFKMVAEKNDCTFIDIHTPLAPQWASLAKDGIHPEEEGQVMLSKIIFNYTN
ncbi:SGNH/GDSL hydrolase family protein [Cyclobacterium marinum]|uniref:Lipolytic protein G-D-S-L family n=1 Tax=Cyclobacterium marinum (strain ATCC 25205 / DSM 745 / LMG 13164 / NCIMB 1802) TaxID=880070 RepID=G0IY56_CYCMS|nr:GDSL-type esterase/lipase family protein [Cyclobacterium marinum]AEL24960.1 lipolytic protein G-D-S-L family [Cyclobacterium marinum DSM 745]